MDDQSKCLPGPLSGPPVMLETLLRVEDVGKEFPMNEGGNFAALRGFSLTISNIEGKPQIVGLLGPSGAGKTTALRIIAALDRPTSGQVGICDGAAEKLRPVRLGDVGVVFQRYPLFEDLKVIDNLVAPAVRSGIPAKEAKEKALSFLDEFDLVRQGLAWPLQLSGGQRQRVAILQQLMLNRHFIILDEPFSGLDPVNVSALAISDHVYLMGRERDVKGEPVPGSRVMKEYDLIAEGLAYRPDIEDLPRFAELRKEIRLIEFPRL
jgi:NitT/TauT family transport system ATP-binding protein